MSKFLKYVSAWVLSSCATIAVVGLSLYGAADGLLTRFAAYCLLTIICLYDYTRFRFPDDSLVDAELALAVAVIALGGVMELMPIMLEWSRTYHISGWIIDCAGAIAGYAVAKLWLQRMWRRHLRRHSPKHRSRRYS